MLCHFVPEFTPLKAFKHQMCLCSNRVFVAASGVLIVYLLQFLVPGADLNLCYLAMSVKLQHIYRAVVPLSGTQIGPMLVDAGEHYATILFIYIYIYTYIRTYSLKHR